MNETELSESAARLGRNPGDEENWRVIFSSLWRYTFAVAFRVLQNEERAEDAAQEAFVRLAFALRDGEGHVTFEHATALRLYLHRIVRNVLVDLRRKESRELTLFDHSDVEDVPAAISVDEQEPLAELLTLVGPSLSARDQAALKLMASGHSNREIARSLGISDSAAIMARLRVRRRVANLLSRNELGNRSVKPVALSG